MPAGHLGGCGLPALRYCAQRFYEVAAPCMGRRRVGGSDTPLGGQRDSRVMRYRIGARRLIASLGRYRFGDRVVAQVG